MTISIDRVRATVRSGITRARYQQRTPARLFKPTGVGTFTDTAPGNRGFTYVRIFQGDGMTGAQAIDRLGVSSPTDDDKPVWLDKDPDGNYIIADWRYEGS